MVVSNAVSSIVTASSPRPVTVPALFAAYADNTFAEDPVSVVAAEASIATVVALSIVLSLVTSSELSLTCTDSAVAIADNA